MKEEMVSPSPLITSFSFFLKKRKGKGKLAWLIVGGAVIFFLLFFLAGLNFLVQGKPLTGVATLTAFLIALWITVQVLTL